MRSGDDESLPFAMDDEDLQAGKGKKKWNDVIYQPPGKQGTALESSFEDTESFGDTAPVRSPSPYNVRSSKPRYVPQPAQAEIKAETPSVVAIYGATAVWNVAAPDKEKPFVDEDAGLFDISAADEPVFLQERPHSAQPKPSPASSDSDRNKMRSSAPAVVAVQTAKQRTPEPKAPEPKFGVFAASWQDELEIARTPVLAKQKSSVAPEVQRDLNIERARQLARNRSAKVEPSAVAPKQETSKEKMAALGFADLIYIAETQGDYDPFYPQKPSSRKASGGDGIRRASPDITTPVTVGFDAPAVKAVTPDEGERDKPQVKELAVTIRSQNTSVDTSSSQPAQPTQGGSNTTNEQSFRRNGTPYSTRGLQLRALQEGSADGELTGVCRFITIPARSESISSEDESTDLWARKTGGSQNSPREL